MNPTNQMKGTARVTSSKAVLVVQMLSNDVGGYREGAMSLLTPISQYVLTRKSGLPDLSSSLGIFDRVIVTAG